MRFVAQGGRSGLRSGVDQAGNPLRRLRLAQHAIKVGEKGALVHRLGKPQVQGIVHQGALEKDEAGLVRGQFRVAFQQCLQAQPAIAEKGGIQAPVQQFAHACHMGLSASTMIRPAPMAASPSEP